MGKKDKDGNKENNKASGAPGGPSSDGPAARGNCNGHTCKSKETRFGFCDEHYQQFKFGLIKKTGDPVPDYDKKLEHYQTFVDRQKSRQAA